MDRKEYEILKAKFLKQFANVPLPLRKEIIAIVNNKPASWSVVYGEIKADSPNAKDILEHLKKLGVL